MTIKWCNPGHIHLKEQLYTPYIELLVISMRPYFLPGSSCMLSQWCMSSPLPTQPLCVTSIISCQNLPDFAHFFFYFYVKCHTRQNRILMQTSRVHTSPTHHCSADITSDEAPQKACLTSPQDTCGHNTGPPTFCLFLTYRGGGC